MVPIDYLTTCVSQPKYWASKATLADCSQAFTMPIPVSHVCSAPFLECLKSSDIGAKISGRQDKVIVDALLKERKDQVQAKKTKDQQKTAVDFNRGGINALPQQLEGAQFVAAANEARVSSVAQSSLPSVSKSESDSTEVKVEELLKMATAAVGKLSAGIPSRPRFDELWRTGKIPPTPQEQLHQEITARGNLNLTSSKHNDAFKAKTSELRMKMEAKLGYILAICPRQYASSSIPYEPPPFKGAVSDWSPATSDSDGNDSDSKTLEQRGQKRKLAATESASEKVSAESEAVSLLFEIACGSEQQVDGAANGVLHANGVLQEEEIAVANDTASQPMSEVSEQVVAVGNHCRRHEFTSVSNKVTNKTPCTICQSPTYFQCVNCDVNACLDCKNRFVKEQLHLEDDGGDGDYHMSTQCHPNDDFSASLSEQRIAFWENCYSDMI